MEQLIPLADALKTQLAASRTTAANLLSALVAELKSAPPTVAHELRLAAGRPMATVACVG